ncbi:MAG: alpha/beta fold hydrolase [Chloroflexi bacterium]|nr:alpha/beta fold hydrolase [Chloroflexota bacterium]
MKIEVNGTRLSYELVGEGPVVTLVHSIGLSTRYGWREQIPLLRRDYTVLSYDLRGLGESEPGTALLTVATFVEDLSQLLGALNIGRTALMGVSLGGLIAGGLAARHPELLCSALVLVSTVCRQSPEGARRLQGRNKNIAARGMRVAVDEQVATHFSPGFVGAHPGVAAWYRATYLANNPTTYTRIMEHLSQRDLCSEFEAIRCPTLIIAGEDDEPSVTGRPPLEAALELQRHIPGAETRGIAGARHYPQLDHPAEFNRMVEPFLRRHSS